MFKLKNNFTILLIILWQAISVFLMATGVWPQEIVYLNTALLAVFFLLASPLDSIRLFILSIPAYVVIPNSYSDTLSMWRPLLILLFTVIAIKTYLSFPRKRESRTWFWILDQVRNDIQRKAFLKSPDFYFIGFIILAALSTLIARYPSETIKQIIFLINAYLIYILIRLTIKTKDQIVTITKSVLISLGLIVVLGFVQFISTFFTSSYYFWQYWATMVSKLYYGQSLADVLIYSNSWFSYTGGGSSLRMFSIMPDSHSFALVCALAFLLCLPFIARRIERPVKFSRSHVNGTVMAILSGLGVILAGTRGVWVGMIAPFGIALILYAKKIFRPASKNITIAFIFIILFFAISPLINQGVGLIREVGRGGFFDRALSIYDLSEQSNVGRLEIWKESATYALIHPLGTGYGNFIVSLFNEIPSNTSYAQLAGMENTRFNLPQKFVTAHSLYLHLLVEVGLLGLLVFLLWFASFLYRSGKYLWHHRNQFSFEHELVLVICLFLIWVLTHGIFDLTLFNDKILLYVFSVMAIAMTILRVNTNGIDSNMRIGTNDTNKELV